MYSWVGFGCLEDLSRFNHLSVISQYGSRRYICINTEIQVERMGFEPQTSCSASQELHHSTPSFAHVLAKSIQEKVKVIHVNSKACKDKMIFRILFQYLKARTENPWKTNCNRNSNKGTSLVQSVIKHTIRFVVHIIKVICM